MQVIAGQAGGHLCLRWVSRVYNRRSNRHGYNLFFESLLKGQVPMRMRLGELLLLLLSLDIEAAAGSCDCFEAVVRYVRRQRTAWEL